MRFFVSARNQWVTATCRRFKRANAMIQNDGLSQGKSQFYYFFAYTDLRFLRRRSLFYEQYAYMRRKISNFLRKDRRQNSESTRILQLR